MAPTFEKLWELADYFERRGNNATDLAKQATLIDMAIRSRYLISEITKLFELAKKMEEA
jgi:hypothetical protein